MKRFFFLFSLLLCIMAAAKAQSYTQHLQEKKQGKASVTITQSREIEELVNGANVSARAQEPVVPATPRTNNTPIKKQNTQETAPVRHATPQHSGDSAHAANHEQAPHRENTPIHRDTHESAQRPEQRKQEAGEQETEPAPVDMRKKVMRRSYKVNGYRVQVFAGGNSRADKIKAQNAGNSVKQAFPSQPVYVHFYSPRWICRVGNFRT